MLVDAQMQPDVSVFNSAERTLTIPQLSNTEAFVTALQAIGKIAAGENDPETERLAKEWRGQLGINLTVPEDALEAIVRHERDGWAFALSKIRLLYVPDPASPLSPRMLRRTAHERIRPYVEKIAKHHTANLLTEDPRDVKELRDGTDVAGFEGKTIDEVFGEGEFVEYLLRLLPKGRDKAIGKVIAYFLLHPDGFGLNTFLSVLPYADLSQDKTIAPLLADSLKNELGLSDLESLENKERVFAEYVLRTCKEGYCYHGFNGVFEGRILSEGLSHESRAWDPEDLQRISAIGRKRGMGMILGWADINSDGNFFVSATPRNLYDYAVASPEWFSQFCAGGMHVPQESHRKQAFYRRDYDTAKMNVEDLCEKTQGMSLDEKIEILSFFEKYWAAFTGENAIPKVALIKRKAISDYLAESMSFHEIATAFCEDPSELTVAKAIELTLGMDEYRLDVPVSKTISASQFSILTLPKYGDIMPKHEQVT